MKRERLEELRLRGPKDMDVDAVREALDFEPASETEALDVIRIARNACAGGERVQTYLLDSRRQFMKDVVDAIVSCDSKSDLVGLRCRLQLVHNAYVGRTAHLERDWDEVGAAVAAVTGHPDARVAELACSLLLLRLRAAPDRLSAEGELGPDALSAMLRPDRGDFAVLAMSALIRNRPDLLAEAYPHLSSDTERTAMLDSILDFLDKEKRIDEVLVALLSSRFKRLSSQLLVTARSSQPVPDPTELVRLLEVLCELSGSEGNEEERAQLQREGSLVVDAVYLIRMMNDVGRRPPSEEAEGENMFSPISKVSEILAEDGAVPEDSPAFGLKCSLVRLVGNLCWECRRNQDLAREAEGVPALLDSAAVDAKNPLITQWVVFAVRNLCRGNTENQAVLASVEGRGVAVSTLAEEFGVKLVVNDDKR